MDDKNLVLKYMQLADDSEEEMEELEVDEMHQMTFMVTSLDEGGSSRRPWKSI